MYENSEDLIECTKCHSSIFANVWDIHRIMCDKHQSKIKRPSSGFFSKLKKTMSSQKNQEEGCLVPCENCGENIQFAVYNLHQEECLGNQFTACKNCNVSVPSFLINEHNQVCVAKKSSMNSSREEEPELEESGDEEDEEMHQSLHMLISRLAAVKEPLKEEGLTRKQIDSLPAITVIKVEDCPICCTPMKRVDRNVRLPCKHIFHRQCIDPWLAQNPLCPMCRHHALQK